MYQRAYLYVAVSLPHCKYSKDSNDKEKKAKGTEMGDDIENQGCSLGAMRWHISSSYYLVLLSTTKVVKNRDSVRRHSEGKTFIIQVKRGENAPPVQRSFAQT